MEVLMHQLAEISFGKFIKNKRVLHGKSVRSFADEIGISAAYLSDVENGNRYPPQKYLSVLIDKLGLSTEEMEIFYDLVGQESGSYVDINIYLKDNENARKALRLAMQKNMTSFDWQKVIDEYIKKI